MEGKSVRVGRTLKRLMQHTMAHFQAAALGLIAQIIYGPSEWHLQDVFGFETLGTCSNSFVRVFKGPGTAIYRSQGTCNSSASHRTVFQC